LIKTKITETQKLNIKLENDSCYKLNTYLYKAVMATKIVFKVTKVFNILNVTENDKRKTINDHP